MKKHNVYIQKVNNEFNSLLEYFNKSFEWHDIKFKKGDRIVIKPNLTVPNYTEGVTTNPRVMEALIVYLNLFTDNVIICEGNGGNYSYTAEDAFKGHGLYELEKKYKFQLVNVCNVECIMYKFQYKNRDFSIPLPRFIVEHQYDYFITLPLMKTHVYTEITIGMKNLWGLIPDTMRMKYHPIMEFTIPEINRLIKPEFSIIDGTIASYGAGPINGNKIAMDLMITSRGVGAGEIIGGELMQYDYKKIEYFKIAKELGILPEIEEINLNVKEIKELDAYKKEKFILYTPIFDRIARHINRSRAFINICYDSKLRDFNYKVLSLFRKRNLKDDIKLWSKQNFPEEYIYTHKI